MSVLDSYKYAANGVISILCRPRNLGLLHRNDEVPGTLHPGLGSSAGSDNPTNLQAAGLRCRSVTIGKDEDTVEAVLVLVGMLNYCVEAGSAAPCPVCLGSATLLPYCLAICIDRGIEVEGGKLSLLSQPTQFSEQHLQLIVTNRTRLIDVDCD